MQVITLSDHSAKQGRAAETKRQKKFDAEKETYQGRLDEQEAKVARLKTATATARRERRYLAWAGCWFSRALLALTPKPPKPVMATPGDDERIWGAGKYGEQIVTERFGAYLSDDWTMIEGYLNRKGEADKILVGPRGVIAMEVKYANGMVFCDGDRWWKDKYDKYGNLVELDEPMKDARGRSPSQQVNEVADLLQAFLSKKAPVKRIMRGVILSHDSSEIGDLQGPTVDFVATMDTLDVEDLIGKLPVIPFDLAPERIVELIKRDNEFHRRQWEERQQNNRRDSRPRRAHPYGSG